MSLIHCVLLYTNQPNKPFFIQEEERTRIQAEQRCADLEDRLLIQQRRQLEAEAEIVTLRLALEERDRQVKEFEAKIAKLQAHVENKRSASRSTTTSGSESSGISSVPSSPGGTRQRRGLFAYLFK